MAAVGGAAAAFAVSAASSGAAPPVGSLVQRPDRAVCVVELHGKLSYCGWYVHLKLQFEGKTNWQYAYNSSPPGCGTALFEGHGTSELTTRVSLFRSFSPGEHQLVGLLGKNRPERRTGMYVEHWSQYDADCRGDDQVASTVDCGVDPVDFGFFATLPRVPKGTGHGRGNVRISSSRRWPQDDPDRGCPFPTSFLLSQYPPSIPHANILNGEFPTAEAPFDSARLRSAHPTMVTAVKHEEFSLPPGTIEPGTGRMSAQSTATYRMTVVPCKLVVKYRGDARFEDVFCGGRRYGNHSGGGDG
jgi:hypothetical protein